MPINEPNAGKISLSRRGFASMSPEKRKAIASKGGKTAHLRGVAHQWTAEEARMAGRKGGETVSRNKEHMASIGRKGGEAAHNGRKKGNTGSRQNLSL